MRWPGHRRSQGPGRGDSGTSSSANKAGLRGLKDGDSYILKVINLMVPGERPKRPRAQASGAQDSFPGSRGCTVTVEATGERLPVTAGRGPREAVFPYLAP